MVNQETAVKQAEEQESAHVDPWNWQVKRQSAGRYRVEFKGAPFAIYRDHWSREEHRWHARFEGDIPTKTGREEGGRGNRLLCARRKRDLYPLIREYVEALFRQRRELEPIIAARREQDRQHQARWNARWEEERLQREARQRQQGAEREEQQRAQARYQSLIDQIGAMETR